MKNASDCLQHSRRCAVSAKAVVKAAQQEYRRRGRAYGGHLDRSRRPMIYTFTGEDGAAGLVPATSQSRPTRGTARIRGGTNFEALGFAISNGTRDMFGCRFTGLTLEIGLIDASTGVRIFESQSVEWGSNDLAANAGAEHPRVPRGFPVSVAQGHSIDAQETSLGCNEFYPFPCSWNFGPNGSITAEVFQSADFAFVATRIHVGLIGIETEVRL